MTKRIATGLLAAPLLALSTFQAPAAIEIQTGVYHVIGTVSLGPNVPSGATISGTASVSIFANGTNQSVSGSATFKRSGATASVVVDVPYKWLRNSAATATVSVALSASTSETGAQDQQNVPVPANGATTAVSFALAM